MGSDLDCVSVCAVCEPCPEGQKMTAVIIKYGEDIDGAALRLEQFDVENRTVVSAYTAYKDKLYAKADNGPFVVLTLSRKDLDSDLIAFDGVGPSSKMLRRTPCVLVRQVLPVFTVSGAVLPPWEGPRPQDTVQEPVVQHFTQETFTSPRTGQTIRYNLALPREYDSTKRYPLLMFIHDKGALSTDTIMSLRQGIGAVVWASKAEQQSRPCFVVAPQYERVPEHDGDPDMLETTFDLCDFLMEQYPIDPRRLYATGQSMGCICEMAMLVRRPDYFTACYLVAGQWEGPEEEVLRLMGRKLFIVVSRGDPRAYPGMNKTLSLLQAHGEKMERADWDQDEDIVPSEQVQELCARPANIHYAVLKTEKRGYCCHMETWQVAYGIEGIRDWLFAQVKDCVPSISNSQSE